MSTWEVIRNLLPILGMVLLVTGWYLVGLSRRPKLRLPVVVRAASHNSAPEWPRLWLAVRTSQQFAVQTALGLRNAKLCSWTEGLSGGSALFVARPVKGWTLILGAALPDPSEDIDLCFRWVCRLSRIFGEVQLFYTYPVLRYHAWILSKRGKIARAYAWAGRTLWNQGEVTPEEQALGLRCFEYLESPEVLSITDEEALEQNVQRVHALAACWGPDPAEFSCLSLERHCGIVGAPSARV